MEGNIFHVYTKGLEKKLWFFDEEDYISGMNAVPCCALGADVSILCFCLMSNHVHFILRGDSDNCIRFIREYKRQRSLQLAAKYKDTHNIAGSEVGIKAVDNEDYIKRLIVYVLRNPMAAGLGVVPTGYRWSSGNLYFSDLAFKQGGFRKLGELSLAKQRRILKTRVHLPEEYLIDSAGIIFPGSYVDYRDAEKMYISARQFLYYLSSTNDMDEELESGILTKARYEDAELFASMESLCSEKFYGRKYSSLKIEDRYTLARLMRKRYGAGPKQLSRVMSLDYDSLKRML